MFTEPNQPVQSISMTRVGDNEYRPSKQGDDKMYMHTTTGITIRQHFAALAMQGQLSGMDCNGEFTDSQLSFIAVDSVRLADALITALNK